MDDKEELKICALWRLDTDLSVTLVDRTAIICSNGPCWKPGRQDVLLRRHLPGRDSGSTTTTSRPGRPPTSGFCFVQRNDTGVADGSTVDAEGCVWNAQLISGELVR